MNGFRAWQHGRAIILTIALLVAACTSSDPAAARMVPESFAPLVKKTLPAVVNIAVTEVLNGSDVLAQLPPELRGTPFERQFRERFRNRREQMIGAGSGFIIDPAGIIVTNNHVVGHADKIVVSLTDRREFPARVIGFDELTDVAVIKVNAPGPLPYVTWGDSRQVEVGDWILAAGNPFGLGGSVTAGIVSARSRDIGAIARQADIVVVAIGQAHFLKADMVRPGAVIVDVGINRLPDGKLAGDVDFAAVRSVERWDRHERIEDVMDEPSFVHLRTHIWRLLREQQTRNAH